MAKRGPKANFRQTQSHIRQIQVAKLLKCLQDHALNGTELGYTRIRAAEILLKHALPLLQLGEGDTEIVIRLGADSRN